MWTWLSPWIPADLSLADLPERWINDYVAATMLMVAFATVLYAAKGVLAVFMGFIERKDQRFEELMRGEADRSRHLHMQSIGAMRNLERELGLSRQTFETALDRLRERDRDRE